MTSSSQCISRAQLWVVSSPKHVSSFLWAQRPFTISCTACSSYILGFFSVSLWMCSLSNFPLCVKKKITQFYRGNQLVLFVLSLRPDTLLDPLCLLGRETPWHPRRKCKQNLGFPLKTSKSQGKSPNRKWLNDNTIQPTVGTRLSTSEGQRKPPKSRNHSFCSLLWGTQQGAHAFCWKVLERMGGGEETGLQPGISHGSWASAALTTFTAGRGIGVWEGCVRRVSPMIAILFLSGVDTVHAVWFSPVAWWVR